MILGGGDSQGTEGGASKGLDSTHGGKRARRGGLGYQLGNLRESRRFARQNGSESRKTILDVVFDVSRSFSTFLQNSRFEDPKGQISISTMVEIEDLPSLL